MYDTLFNVHPVKDSIHPIIFYKSTIINKTLIFPNLIFMFLINFYIIQYTIICHTKPQNDKQMDKQTYISAREFGYNPNISKIYDIQWRMWNKTGNRHKSNTQKGLSVS